MTVRNPTFDFSMPFGVITRNSCLDRVGGRLIREPDVQNSVLAEQRWGWLTALPAVNRGQGLATGPQQSVQIYAVMESLRAWRRNAKT